MLLLLRVRCHAGLNDTAHEDYSWVRVTAGRCLSHTILCSSNSLPLTMATMVLPSTGLNRVTLVQWTRSCPGSHTVTTARALFPKGPVIIVSA
jgi:hypothetical protein